MQENILIVLAGGFGTRLRSEINNLPKALAPVCEKPFLGYIVENWVEQGINHFIFSLHYEADQIINYIESLKGNTLINCKIQYFIEDTPLGTGGAIVNIIKNAKLKTDFLVANADTWIDGGVAELLLINGLGMCLIEVKNIYRYGEVFINSKNQITKFNEKNNQNKPGYINAGLYKFSSNTFNGFSKRKFSLEIDFLPEFVNTEKINAVILKSSFIDIGIPGDYKKFQKWIEGNKSLVL